MRKTAVAIVALIVICQTRPVFADVVLDITSEAGRTIVSRDVGVSGWNATPITTDGSAYQLNSITAEIEDFFPAGTLFMEIWSTNNVAAPDASIGRLTLFDNQLSEKTFTGGLTLLADTSYFVVTGVDNGGANPGWRERVNLADFSVDSGPWLLETKVGLSAIQTSYSSTNLGVSWQSDGLLSSPLRMTISATAVPEPGSGMFLAMIAVATCVPRRRRSHAA